MTPQQKAMVTDIARAARDMRRDLAKPAADGKRPTIAQLNRALAMFEEIEKIAMAVRALDLPDSPVPSTARPMGEVLGATENIGSTTRDKPAPFLPPPFSD